MKKKNPSDLTLRNLHAMKKRIIALESKVKRMSLKMLTLMGSQA